MPSLPTVLTRLFLGIPGSILWIAGGIGSAFLGFTAFLKASPPTLPELRNLGLAVVSVCVGYLMVAADGMISPLNRRRVVGDHLPELIGMELGLQLAAILSLCLSVGWVGRIGTGDAATIAAFSIASILAILGMTRLYQRLKDCIERWEKEYEALEATETPLPD